MNPSCRCINCSHVIRQERVWWICSKNRVNRTSNDNCIMEPTEFKKYTPPLQTEREKILNEIIEDLNKKLHDARGKEII